MDAQAGDMSTGSQQGVRHGRTYRLELVLGRRARPGRYLSTRHHRSQSGPWERPLLSTSRHTAPAPANMAGDAGPGPWVDVCRASASRGPVGFVPGTYANRPQTLTRRWVRPRAQERILAPGRERWTSSQAGAAAASPPARKGSCVRRRDSRERCSLRAVGTDDLAISRSARTCQLTARPAVGSPPRPTAGRPRADARTLPTPAGQREPLPVRDRLEQTWVTDATLRAPSHPRTGSSRRRATRVAHSATRQRRLRRVKPAPPTANCARYLAA